jgi:hypothetical protein
LISSLLSDNWDRELVDYALKADYLQLSSNVYLYVKHEGTVTHASMKNQKPRLNINPESHVADNKRQMLDWSRDD